MVRGYLSNRISRMFVGVLRFLSLLLWIVTPYYYSYCSSQFVSVVSLEEIYRISACDDGNLTRMFMLVLWLSW